MRNVSQRHVYLKTCCVRRGDCGMFRSLAGRREALCGWASRVHSLIPFQSILSASCVLLRSDLPASHHSCSLPHLPAVVSAEPSGTTAQNKVSSELPWCFSTASGSQLIQGLCQKKKQTPFHEGHREDGCYKPESGQVEDTL